MKTLNNRSFLLGKTRNFLVTEFFSFLIFKTILICCKFTQNRERPKILDVTKTEIDISIVKAVFRGEMLDFSIWKCL